MVIFTYEYYLSNTFMTDYILRVVGWIGTFIVIGKLFKRPHMKIAQMTHYASLINHKYGAINFLYIIIYYVLNFITFKYITLLSIPINYNHSPQTFDFKFAYIYTRLNNNFSGYLFIIYLKF